MRLASQDEVDFQEQLIIERESEIRNIEQSVGELNEFERAMIPPREIITLYDYRTRIGQYRTDHDLALAHQNFAWITVWVG